MPTVRAAAAHRVTFAVVAAVALAAGCHKSSATTPSGSSSGSGQSSKTTYAVSQYGDTDYYKVGDEAGTNKSCGGNTGCPCDSDGYLFCGHCEANSQCGYCPMFAYCPADPCDPQCYMHKGSPPGCPSDAPIKAPNGTCCPSDYPVPCADGSHCGVDGEACPGGPAHSGGTDPNGGGPNGGGSNGGGSNGGNGASLGAACDKLASEALSAGGACGPADGSGFQMPPQGWVGQEGGSCAEADGDVLDAMNNCLAAYCNAEWGKGQDIIQPHLDSAKADLDGVAQLCSNGSGSFGNIQCTFLKYWPCQ